MPAHDSGISLVQTNKKAQFIHMRTKRALFRGTTSFRRTLPHRRTRYPDSSPIVERFIRSRYNGLTRADLLCACCGTFLQQPDLATFDCGYCGGFQPLAIPSLSVRSTVYSSRREMCIYLIVYIVPVMLWCVNAPYSVGCMNSL